MTMLIGFRRRFPTALIGGGICRIMVAARIEVMVMRDGSMKKYYQTSQ